jgi:hypothetical protein
MQQRNVEVKHLNRLFKTLLIEHLRVKDLFVLPWVSFHGTVIESFDLFKFLDLDSFSA